jgi:hypothetical protein
MSYELLIKSFDKLLTDSASCVANHRITINSGKATEFALDGYSLSSSGALINHAYFVIKHLSSI